jgi:hypothetical protein
LALSPDIIWLAIAQGFAKHVNENAESLRKKFVSHEGKKEIVIMRDESDPLKLDWQGIIEDFSFQIKESIGEEAHSTLVPTFSTTTNTSSVACQITLMDAMKNYF